MNHYNLGPSAVRVLALLTLVSCYSIAAQAGSIKHQPDVLDSITVSPLSQTALVGHLVNIGVTLTSNQSECQPSRPCLDILALVQDANPRTIAPETQTFMEIGGDVYKFVFSVTATTAGTYSFFVEDEDDLAVSVVPT